MDKLLEKNNTPILIIGLMATMVMAIMASTLWLLYEASCTQQLERLAEIARSRSSLIEAITRSNDRDQYTDSEGYIQAVLKQVREVHTNFGGFGTSGEFIIARHNGDNIEFLSGHRHDKQRPAEPAPFNSIYAEPMRRALQGESGTMSTVDFRAIPVFTAYEPVAQLGWGVVAKIDISEVRAPYIKAAIISMLIAALIIAVGSLFIIRVVAPLLKQLLDEYRFRLALFQSSPIGLVLCKLDGTLVETNIAYNRIIGRPLEESRKLKYWDITPEKYRDMEAEQLWQLEARGEYGPYEKEYIHKDGTLVPVRLKGRMFSRGGEDYIWSSVEDIGDRVRAEKSLRQAAAIFESTDEGIVITDENNCIIKVNSAYCEITGYSEAEVMGHNPGIIKSSKHDAAFYSSLWRHLESEGSWRGEMWNMRKDGTLFPVWQQITVIKDDNRVSNYVSIFSDISELKVVEQQLVHLAHHDELTGLHNRLYFKAQMEQNIQSAKRNQQMMALLFLDLDGFKQINDNFGHDVGDHLLKEIARRLKGLVREEDTVARFGGDEFVVILKQIHNSEDATLVAGNIVEAVTHPILCGEQTISPSTSIGISIYPNDAESVQGLQKAADHAMYAAKGAGKNSYKLAGTGDL